MNRLVRRWLSAAVLIGVALTAPDALGQAPPAGPAALPRREDVPSAPDAPQTLPVPKPADIEPPAPYVLPPAGWPQLEFPKPDPLLDRPSAPLPGFFVNVETDVDWLHFRNQLKGPVNNPFTGTTDLVQFAGNPFDPALSLHVEFGYRLQDGWGTLGFEVRNLSTQGHEQLITGPEDAVQGLADQRGRLSYTILGLEYTSWEFSLGPVCNMRWGLGARMMFFYVDSRLNFFNPGTAPGSVQSQSESLFNTDWGGLAFLVLERKIGDSGLGVFGRFEFTDYFGRSDQNYAETVAGNPGERPQFLETNFSGSVGVPVARGVIGLSYTVPGWNNTQFMIGYEYETFFQIGRLTSTTGIPDTRGQLDQQGLFLRGELNF
jgi:hypothetical protein